MMAERASGVRKAFKPEILIAPEPVSAPFKIVFEGMDARGSSPSTVAYINSVESRMESVRS